MLSRKQPQRSYVPATALAKEVEFDDAMMRVTFTPDGKMVVTGGSDGAARRWDVAMGKEFEPPLRHGNEVRAVAFSPDGKTILTGGFDGTARLWDATTGKQLLRLDHDGWVHAVAFSPDGEIIVTG